MQILSREAVIDEEKYKELVEKAVSEGYDVSKLQRTTHSQTPPDSDEAAKDKVGFWWIKSIFGK